MKCPEHNTELALRKGPRRWYRACRYWPDCSYMAAVDRTLVPVGKPVPSPNKAARERAHRVFDRLWIEGRMPRSQAYQWLSEAMDMPLRESHMGKMTPEQCARVVELVKQELNRQAAARN